MDPSSTSPCIIGIRLSLEQSLTILTTTLPPRLRRPNTGPYADELARSLHTLALVLGMDIFFRNGAYRPESEEGRKILAHELTHVAQNKKREEYRGASREELEREAEAAEKQVENSEERCREIVFKGKKYKVSERRYKQVMDEVKNRVEYVAEHNTQGLDEEEYLKFLIAYRDMERNGEMIWQK